MATRRRADRWNPVAAAVGARSSVRQIAGAKEVSLVGAGVLGHQLGVTDAVAGGVKAVVWDSPSKLAGSLHTGWWQSLALGTKVGVAAVATTAVTAAGVGAAGWLLSDSTVEVQGFTSMVGATGGHVLISDAEGLIVTSFDDDPWRPAELVGHDAAVRGLWGGATVEPDGTLVMFGMPSRLATPGFEPDDDVVSVVSLADQTFEQITIELDLRGVVPRILDGDRLIGTHDDDDIWIGNLTDQTERTIELGSPPAEIVPPGLEATLTGVEPIAMLPSGTHVLARATHTLVDPLVRAEQQAAGEPWTIEMEDNFVVVDLAGTDPVVWGGPLNGNWTGQVHLSPDGTDVALYGNQRIVVYDALTAALIAEHSVPFNDLQVGNPWSPDGTRLVFEDTNAIGDPICTFEIATGDVICFEDTPFLLGDPIWDLDSDRIVAITNSNAGGEPTAGIWILDPDTGAAEQLLAFDRN